MRKKANPPVRETGDTGSVTRMPDHFFAGARKKAIRVIRIHETLGALPRYPMLSRVGRSLKQASRTVNLVPTGQEGAIPSQPTILT